MRDYYLPTSWYEQDYQSLQACDSCEQKEQTLEDAQEYLSQLIHHLYGKEPLDVAKFEDVLDELCYLFDVKLPATLPTVERKKETNLENWIEFNNNHLKQLA